MHVPFFLHLKHTQDYTGNKNRFVSGAQIVQKLMIQLY
jgi:hypothetical protein